MVVLDGQVGVGQGLGKDWAAFRVGPNASTGLMPHETYASPGVRITRRVPNPGDLMILAGFGVDDGVDNQVLQAATGPFVGTYVGNASPDVFHAYRVDSRGGNSGGPIFWFSPGGAVAIGIHTDGGCTDDGGYNAATSFGVGALNTAVNTVLGPNVVHLDRNHPFPSSTEWGSVASPYLSMIQAALYYPDGANLSIVSGTYSLGTFELGADGRSVTLTAPVGPVVITR